MEGLEEAGFEIVTPRDEGRRAGIVVFKARDPYAIAGTLERRGIVVSARPGIIRVSPHFYNTIEEIEAILEHLKPAR